MKNEHSEQKFNSTLSCMVKCIRFFINMFNKKKFFGLFVLILMNACSSPTAMLGPAYSLTSSGNIYQAGLNYGSNQMVILYTGKTPIENIKEISSAEKSYTKNIERKTLESEDFYFLVKNRIEKTNKVLKSSN